MFQCLNLLIINMLDDDKSIERNWMIRSLHQRTGEFIQSIVQQTVWNVIVIENIPDTE